MRNNERQKGEIMKGLFGDVVDFNHDGYLDGFEKAAAFAAFATILDEMDEECETEDEKEDFESVGLDMDELEMMDDGERKEALEEAGLDPDNYYF